MNYLQYCQGGTGEDGILYIQGTSIPSTGDPEKDKLLLLSYQLYLNDKPLSGTDPIGEFYVSGAVLGKPLLLLGKGIKLAGKTIYSKLLLLADKRVLANLKNFGSTSDISRNYKFIGKGAENTVFESGDNVIKINSGLESSVLESPALRKATEALLEKLSAVIPNKTVGTSNFGTEELFVTTQPKVSKVGLLQDEIKALENVMQSNGFKGSAYTNFKKPTVGTIADVSPSRNSGLDINGNPVIFDYLFYPSKIGKARIAVSALFLKKYGGSINYINN